MAICEIESMMFAVLVQSPNHYITIILQVVYHKS